jgi:hypothetical protein
MCCQKGHASPIPRMQTWPAVWNVTFGFIAKFYKRLSFMSAHSARFKRDKLHLFPKRFRGPVLKLVMCGYGNSICRFRNYELLIRLPQWLQFEIDKTPRRRDTLGWIVLSSAEKEQSGKQRTMNWTTGVQFQKMDRLFSSLQRPDQLWAQQVSNLMGIEFSFPGGKTDGAWI